MSDTNDLAALMLAASTGGFGVVYSRNHEFAQKHRVFGTMPVISIWGHSGTSTLQPRIVDLQTAQEYIANSEVNGIAGTKPVRGNIADYKVRLPSDE